jgi:hypothetical protein
MQTERRKEHEWLDQFLGEWTSEGEATMGPDQPPMTFTGTESVRSLGGLWIVAEGQGGMPDGGPDTWLLTLGFDPDTQRFVGSWIGSMMTWQWRYEGTLDAAGRTLTLDCEGPSMAEDGTLARYQDIHEFRGDQRVLSSRVQGADGQWQTFMTVTYQRKP